MRTIKVNNSITILKGVRIKVGPPLSNNGAEMSLLTPERRVSGTILLQRRYSRVLDAPVVHHTARGPAVRVDEAVDSTEGAGTQEGGSHGRVLSPEARRFGNLLAQGTVAGVVFAGVMFNLIGYSGLLSLFHLFGFALTYSGMFVVCCGLFVWWRRSQCPSHCDLGPTRTLTLYVLCTVLDMAALLLTRHPAIVALTMFPSQMAYFLLLGTSLLVVVALVAQRGGLGAVFARDSLVFVALVVVLHFSTSCLFHQVLPAVLLPQLVYVSVLAGLTLCETNQQFGFLSLSKLRQQLQQQQLTRDRLSVSSVNNFKYAITPGRKFSVTTNVSVDGDSSQSLRPGRHSVSSTGSTVSFKLNLTMCACNFKYAATYYHRCVCVCMMYVCMHVCVQVCVREYVCVCVHDVCMYASMCMYVCVCVCVQVCAYLCACLDVHVHVLMCMCMSLHWYLNYSPVHDTFYRIVSLTPSTHAHTACSLALTVPPG